MASLSKNGTETARFDQLGRSYSIRSNGVVLKNIGQGWKVCKLKEGISADAFQQTLQEIEDKLTPAFRAYRKAVQNEFPLSVRWKYLTLRELLGSDIDGIWASLDDDGIHTDIETLRELHQLCEAARLERNRLKSETATA